MDISAEIAAIQAASQGSELRQPLVGALNKLNSGSLPAVTSSDAGKILKVGANGWEVGEKSGYMPVPSTSLNISTNNTYDVTNYAEVVVNVQPSGKINITQNGTDIDVANYALADVAVSGGATLVQKTITQNGTYDPADDNADGYSEVTVNVGGSNFFSEYYDLTNSFVGENYGLEPAYKQNVTISNAGATFAKTGYILFQISYPYLTIEIETGSFQMTSSEHRRFVMIGNTSNMGNGFIYRNNGKWAFYNGSWVDTEISDGSYFDNCIVKIIIDADGIWYIYKNNILIYTNNTKPLKTSMGFLILGSNGGGIANGVIKNVKIDGNFAA